MKQKVDEALLKSQCWDLEVEDAVILIKELWQCMEVFSAMIPLAITEISQNCMDPSRALITLEKLDKGLKTLLPAEKNDSESI